MNLENYFFVGIAGTGMSAIAQYLNGIGKKVSGSDRQFEKHEKLPIQLAFENIGIMCFRQDASGISDKTGIVVISTAIEESNPEIQKARQLNIPIVKRSELLASISNSQKTIAVGGTSGKSTTTAMIFHILKDNNVSPSLITGAGLSDLQKDGLPGNAFVGKSNILVIEADESDGSIVGYKPETGLLLNIDRDHKSFEELIDLFTQFKNNTTKTFIVNNDHELTKTLKQNDSHCFGTTGDIGFLGKDFKQNGYTIEFTCNKIEFSVSLIGKHNMENAIAAVAVCSNYGVSIENSAKALKSFKGIYRRTQIVGQHQGVTVIDDFAHNPAEVKAAIKACQNISDRVIAWFQPHGFGPLRFMKQELIDEISNTLRDDDYIFMSDVYYAGGTVSKDINSDIIIDEIRKKKTNAVFVADRSDLKEYFNKIAKSGDTIILMGARDTTLEQFASEIFTSIQNRV